MKVFVALGLPEVLAQQLALMGGGIPGARWEPLEKLHLTLRYIGDAEGSMLDDIDAALARVRTDPFKLTLAGVGHFPPRGKPRSVWAGVQDPTDVTTLHDKVDRVLQTVGVDPDRRKFSPHVTLARLKNSPEHKVAEFLAHHSLFVAPAFSVEEFALYSTIRGPAGSKYRVEKRYPVSAAP